MPTTIQTPIGTLSSKEKERTDLENEDSLNANSGNEELISNQRTKIDWKVKRFSSLNAMCFISEKNLRRRERKTKLLLE